MTRKLADLADLLEEARWAIRFLEKLLDRSLRNQRSAIKDARHLAKRCEQAVRRMEATEDPAERERDVVEVLRYLQMDLELHVSRMQGDHDESSETLGKFQNRVRVTGVVGR